tara:strand:+ start:695 stop:868 length:174 start_codon:yes stop_codon:yes gene_type:complete
MRMLVALALCFVLSGCIPTIAVVPLLSGIGTAAFQAKEKIDNKTVTEDVLVSPGGDQ